MNKEIFSLLPIIICFSVIFINKNPFIAIGGGILTSLLILYFENPNFYFLASSLEVITSTSTIKTLFFILIIGALVKAMDKSGGIKGLVTYLELKKININSKIGVQLFTMLIGILLFVDATSSIAITSVVGKPLFEKAGISKEKLALIVNSTASPIAWLIPITGAGAILSSLISQVEGIGDNSFNYVFKAVPFHFYTIILLIILILSVIFNFDMGGIRKIKVSKSSDTKIDKSYIGKARNMVVPIIVLILSIIFVLLITGGGNILRGNSSDAVFYGGLIALLFTLIFFKVNSKTKLKDCLFWYYDGIKSMALITLLLLIAFIFSNLLSKVGTAKFLLSLFKSAPLGLLPFIALVLSSAISISTGTSGGTVAIITPIFLPIALLGNVNIPLLLGAIVSGAVFGDQNSIISDSVILTCSVTGVEPRTHVKTQLPYTIVSLILSAVLFLILGLIY